LHLKLQIEKMQRDLYGRRSERKARLLDQMELQLKSWRRARPRTKCREEGGGWTQSVSSFERKRPSRKPFPEHLPRERVGHARAGVLPMLQIGAALQTR
jgi:hypothetical protein